MHHILSLELSPAQAEMLAQQGIMHVSQVAHAIQNMARRQWGVALRISVRQVRRVVLLVGLGSLAYGSHGATVVCTFHGQGTDVVHELHVGPVGVGITFPAPLVRCLVANSHWRVEEMGHTLRLLPSHPGEMTTLLVWDRSGRVFCFRLTATAGGQLDSAVCQVLVISAARVEKPPRSQPN